MINYSYTASYLVFNYNHGVNYGVNYRAHNFYDNQKSNHLNYSLRVWEYIKNLIIQFARGCLLHQYPWALADQTVELSVAVLPNNIVRPDLQGSHTGTLITLIGSGPTVAARTGNNEYFVGTFLKFGCLIPRNMLTNAANGIKYKCFSVHPHIAWEKNYKSSGQKVNLSAWGSIIPLPSQASKDSVCLKIPTLVDVWQEGPDCTLFLCAVGPAVNMRLLQLLQQLAFSQPLHVPPGGNNAHYCENTAQTDKLCSYN